MRAEIYPSRKPGGRYRRDGVMLAIEKLLRAAEADVKKGREFWMNLAGTSASARRASREIPNRHH